MSDAMILDVFCLVVLGGMTLFGAVRIAGMLADDAHARTEHLVRIREGNNK